MSVVFDALQRLPVVIVTFMEPFDVKTDTVSLHEGTDKKWEDLQEDTIYRIINIERLDELHYREVRDLLLQEARSRRQARGYDLIPLVVANSESLNLLERATGQRNIEDIPVFGTLEEAYAYVRQDLGLPEDA